VALPVGQVQPGEVSASDDGSIPLDLRIGVTGHRKLVPAPALSTAIDQAIDLILERLRPAVRDRCTLVAVSALAEGADRLVAERVLARPGARLEVVLPLPEADYATDFDAGGSRAEFSELLGSASWRDTVPPQPTREDAYAEAGRVIADRADVTIAIWDGLPAVGKGGTGDVVGYLRAQGRPWVWVAPDGGPATARNLDQLASTGWLTIQDPDLGQLDEFNERALDPGQRSAIIDEFRQNILSGGGPDLAAELNVLLEWLQASFARAELLARKFQSRYHRLSSLLFVLAALAVCIVGTQLVFFPHVRQVVAGEIACLLIILGLLEWGRRARIQQRWISARYLAERLRNAFFLALTSTDERPPPTVPVDEDIPATPWVGVAYRMAWMRRPRVDVAGVPVASLRGFLSRVWVDHQRRYFSDASARDKRRHHVSTQAAEALFGASVVIAIIHVALGGPEGWGQHAVSVLAISVPACAAALVGYTTQREYLRNSLRYGRMADSLINADNLLLAAADHAQVREISAAVDRMLREERGEWFGTIGLHDLKLPA